MSTTDFNNFYKSVEYDIATGALPESFLCKYTLGSLLYKGANSTIYLLTHSEEGTYFTLKAISKETPLKLNSRMKSIDHPNIAKVVFTYESTHFYYILKPYIEGTSLRKLVNEQGPIETHLANHLLIQLINILNHLHSHGIVFRDIKPNNLIKGNDDTLYLIDIESIREVDASLDSDTVSVVSRGFAAPEQYGFARSDQRSDIYAFGSTAYYLFTGEVPLWGASLDFKKIPTKWRHVVRKCMAIDPDQRYASVVSMQRSLNRKNTMLISLLIGFIVLLTYITYLPTSESLGPSPIEANAASLPYVPRQFIHNSNEISGSYEFTGKINLTKDLNMGFKSFMVLLSNPYGDTVLMGGEFFDTAKQHHRYSFTIEKSNVLLQNGIEYTGIMFIDNNLNNTYDQGELRSIKRFVYSDEEHLTLDFEF